MRTFGRYVWLLVPMVLGAAPAWPSERKAPELTVVSWGGAYTRSQILGFVRDYEAKSGTDIDMIDYAGGIDEIRSQVRAYNVKWDVVDLELFDAIRACREGLLVRIDSADLPDGSDGTPAVDDFLPGTLTPCGVGNLAGATIIAYDAGAVKRAPRSLSDFFDPRRFPGARGLRRTPQTNLEWALISDGVSPDRVYELLDTEQGVERAFRVLDRIKPLVKWWRLGEEAVRLLETGQVVMTSAYNGRIFSARERGEPLAIIWDHNARYVDVWGIPANGKYVEAAQDFVRFATSTKSLARQATYISYGPSRRSSVAELTPGIRQDLPTSQA
ncbi:MAG: ABC transporter substrate-binding protein, partial [Pseudomonadales bacterium]|nr:ABC transporter substrate-binding protein [Pseudomonadales bacterium]